MPSTNDVNRMAWNLGGISCAEIVLLEKREIDATFATSGGLSSDPALQSQWESIDAAHDRGLVDPVLFCDFRI